MSEILSEAVLRAFGPWLLAALLVLTAVAAVLSALLDRAGHIRVRHWIENAGDRLRQLYRSHRRFEAFRFLMALGARGGPVLVLVLSWAVLRAFSAEGAALWAILLTGASILVNEWLGRVVVRLHAESSLERSSLLYRMAAMLLTPAIWLLAPLVPRAAEARANGEDDDEDEASEDEIDAYIDVGRREGILEPEEGDLVRSVVDFGDTQVRSVMTPRVEIQSAPVDADYETLASKFFESKNSRLPLYSGSIDEVEGILHIRDLFEAVHSGREEPPRELCQQPHYVPESKPLPDLLTELQERHQQMAIVVDEYGGVAGLVTVEDLVEEIVGDIRDEHEPQAGHERLGEATWRVPGRVHLEDLEELLQVDLDVDDLPYETLSGLICGELGYVPKRGEEVSQLGLDLVIDEADERRITLVTVHRPQEAVVSSQAMEASGARASHGG
ncbi:MAG: hemolysin family protein [Holophagales bacterium]|nr:hemolysin family protein [Holophagales bacterium]